MNSLYGSIRTGDGMVYQGGCQLFFEKDFLVIKWSAFAKHQEKILYSNIKMIFYSRFYAKIKIVYLKNNNQNSIVFQTFSFLQRRCFLSNEVKSIIERYSINVIEYSKRNHSYSSIKEKIRFWMFFDMI